MATVIFLQSIYGLEYVDLLASVLKQNKQVR
jgi:hypothetical protein